MLNEAEMATFLTAPKAKKWVNCPGSVELELLVPYERSVESSVFSEESSLLHEMTRECLICDKSPDDWLLEAREEIAMGEEAYLFPEHYLEPLDYYVDYVRSTRIEDDATLLIEKDVSFDLLVPGGHGTVDAIVIDGETCHIIHLSAKPERLEAKDNHQLILYALGAMFTLRKAFRCDTFNLTIVQPMHYHRSSWVITHDELLAWGKVITKQVESAVSTQPHFSPSLAACSQCRARGLCKPLADHCMEMMTTIEQHMKETLDMRHINLMSAHEISEALDQLPLLALWKEALEHQAMEKIEQGVNIPGYELKSTKPKSSWNNVQAAAIIMDQLKLDYLKKQSKRALLPEHILSPDEIKHQHSEHLYLFEGFIETKQDKSLIKKTTIKQSLPKPTDCNIKHEVNEIAA